VDPALTVLLVEDDRLLARSMSRALGEHGFYLVSAPSRAAAEALECGFDVGVFDVDLGDGCGIELAQRLIRANMLRRALFFTGVGDLDRLSRARAVGAVVEKQAGLEPLLALLRAAAEELREYAEPA
jgi:DNA-binding response OmpR family regulator